jgi:hypothetical protein
MSIKKEIKIAFKQILLEMLMEAELDPETVEIIKNNPDIIDRIETSLNNPKIQAQLGLTESSSLDENVFDKITSAVAGNITNIPMFNEILLDIAQDGGDLTGVISRYGAAKIIEFLAVWKAKKEKLKHLRQRFRLDQPLSPEGEAHRARKRRLQRQP